MTKEVVLECLACSILAKNAIPSFLVSATEAILGSQVSALMATIEFSVCSLFV